VTVDSVDMANWYIGTALEIVLIGLLTWKRIAKKPPVFSIYILWDVANNLILFSIKNLLTSQAYLFIFTVGMYGDAVLILAVWFELISHVFDYNHLSRSAWYLLTFFILVANILLWLVVQRMPQPAYTTTWNFIYVDSRQIIGILWVAIILAITGFSRMRNLRWPEKELQIVSGFAFCFIVDLVVNILRTHAFMRLYYRRLDQFAVACYLGTVCYWALSFSRDVENKQDSYA
jgi:hypothetical protein